MTESSPRFRSGQLFAADLRAIREERGVELRDIIDATRLAEDVVEQFEQTALLDNPVFNRVYLRSLVSSYARLIDIDENVALQGLEDTLRGEYEGSLGKIYLGEEPRSGALTETDETVGTGEAEDADDPSTESVAEPDADEMKEPPGDPDPANMPDSSADPADPALPDGSSGAGAGGPAGDAGKDGSETGDHPERNEAAAAATATPAAESDTGSAEGEVATETAESEGRDAAKASAGETARATATPEPVDGPSTAASRVSPIAGPSDSRKGLLLPDMRGLVAAIVAGVVLIALVWISVAWFLDNPEEPAAETPVPVVDSVAVEPEPTPEPVTLPDTFEVRVIARDEPLDPIRSRVDNDLRRPYWVELGDTLVFRAADTVVLEREVDHALVTVEHWLPPAEWLDRDGTYLISRARVQNWLDSLVTEGIFPPEAPDSLVIPGLEELRSGATDSQ